MVPEQMVNVLLTYLSELPGIYTFSVPIYIGIPGAVLKVERNGFVVKTEDSFVRVLEWTSKEMIKVGDRFK